jgi:hypothetical protein
MNRIVLLVGVLLLLCAGVGAAVGLGLFGTVPAPVAKAPEEPATAPPQGGEPAGDSAVKPEAVLKGEGAGEPKAGAVSLANTGVSNQAPASPLAPPCEKWATPSAAILLSGEQNGSIEPCGCSLVQLGGMSRRMDLHKLLADRGWPVLGFDLGGTLNAKRATRAQSKLKFETTLAGLKEMKYGALALGRQELSLGLDLVSYHNPDELPFLSANASIYPPELNLPLKSRVFEIGGVKIGVTAVIGDQLREEITPKVPIPADQRVGGEIDIGPAAEAVSALMPALEAEKCDLLILLSHGTPEEAAVLSGQFPQFHLVVTAGGPEDPDPRPKKVGDALVVSVGQKGKHAGVVGVYPSASASERIKFELVDLDKDRFPGAERMNDLMRLYQDQLKDRNLAGTEPAVPHPTGDKYVGAKVCGECHTKAFDTWKKSKHSHGLDSLEKGRKGYEATWISRVFDAECLACHVTGWNPQDVLRYESGFTSLAETPHLAGQQCENCHGPGERHSNLELAAKGRVTKAVLAERKAMYVDLNTVEIKVCTKCHDGDNSPGWNFQKYWAQVRHVGRD